VTFVRTKCGRCPHIPDAQRQWTRRMAERNMRACGGLIGPQLGHAPLDEISDAVFLLDDLGDDPQALEVSFCGSLFFK
jgi:hypothetical protein